MSKFNFSNTLGGAAFGSLNAFLSHNASRDGYSKPNRYEVMIYLPAGVSGASVQDAGESATNVKGLKNSEAAMLSTHIPKFIDLAFFIPFPFPNKL